MFSDDLKLAEISPFFKNGDDLEDKGNYRPVNVLFIVSKVFERIICSQINAFMQDKLPNLLTGFRKIHTKQHCLMYMLEIWKNMLDKGRYVVMICTMICCCDMCYDVAMICAICCYDMCHDMCYTCSLTMLQ